MKSNRAVRFLAFGLGSLLLLHGIDKLVHGTQFIENMIVGIYVPSKTDSTCSICFGGIMFGTMEQMLINSALSPYRVYIKLASYLVYIGELVAPLFLIFGHYIKTASSIIAFNMLIVIFLAYRNQLFSLNEYGAWILEVPLLYLIGAITLILSKRE